MNTSTTRSITYNGDTIEYELTIKRVKNINMRVHKDGSVHVSANAMYQVIELMRLLLKIYPLLSGPVLN